MSADDGEMTLLFTLDALRRLSDPAAAVEDAGRWSAGVGAAAEDHDDLTAFLDREGVDPDFVSGERGLVGGLAAIRQRVHTERHVVVGATVESETSAEALGWEYLDVAAAAEEAGWRLAAEDR